MKNKNLLSIGASLLISTVSCLSLAASDDLLQISNTPQCAADLSKPTQSIFLSGTFRDTALMLKELAPQIGKDSVSFINEGNRIFQIKLTTLTEKILKGLDSGELPFISKKNDSAIRSTWSQLSAAPTLKNISEINCYQVNDINSYYSHLFIRGINQSTLTALAEQYKKNSTRLNGCSKETITANSNLYPIFNYDLQIKDSKKWEQTGFDYWVSFKIYLSWAWRNADVAGLNEGAYKTVFKTIPVEEQVVLLSNGCKSIGRPECNSDFLSSTELRRLFSLNQTRLDLKGSTIEMRDSIIDNNTESDLSAQTKFSTQAADNEWVRTFQKSYMGATQSLKNKLYQSNKVMSSLLNQVGMTRFKNDLVKSYKDNAQSEKFYYLCSEARLIGQEKPLSVFKFDLDFIQKHGSELNNILKYGLTIEEMVATYKNLSPALIEMCDQFDKSLKSRPEIKESWTDYRPWYKSYLSRYKIIKEYLDLENEEKKQDIKEQSIDLNYVKGYCEDSVDCARKTIETVVNINAALLHSKMFLRNDITSAPLFNEMSEKVSCGMYDPWEAGKLNKKNFISDLGSSVIFSLTNIPIYLDLKFQPKQLVSMNKLIENGHVKFDMGFDQGEIKKTLSLNFGSFINVPCSITLSQVKGEEQNQSAPYMMNGLTASMCKGTKYDSLMSPDGSIDAFKKTPETDLSMCGQCSISFQQVAATAAKNTIAPVRFIIRAIEAYQRYKANKDNDTINPRLFSVNKNYLLAAYEKYNGIPEKCVPQLSRGLKCLENMCESLAVKEFESKSGLEVSEISLSENYENSGSGHSYDSAYIKVAGCQKEIRVPMTCRENGSSFYMYVSDYAANTCKKESLK